MRCEGDRRRTPAAVPGSFLTDEIYPGDVLVVPAEEWVWTSKVSECITGPATLLHLRSDDGRQSSRIVDHVFLDQHGKQVTVSFPKRALVSWLRLVVLPPETSNVPSTRTSASPRMDVEAHGEIP